MIPVTTPAPVMRDGFTFVNPEFIFADIKNVNERVYPKKPDPDFPFTFRISCIGYLNFSAT